MKNDVRQDSVISCWMFNVYVNHLVYVMESSGNGCMMQGKFVCCVLYADDILLMSMSKLKLQKLLKIHDLFAKDHFLVLMETNVGV